jgi:imidazolonepropionase
MTEARAFTGHGRLLLASERAEDTPGTITGPWTVVARESRITSVRSGGPASDDPDELIDLGSALVTPGLVDAHTHLIHAGDRSDETAARSAGEAYAGGGILRTVERTRRATDDDLRDGLERRLRSALAHGTTTIEVKSGYGLSAEQELRLLRLTGEVAARVPMRVVRTYLGAHAVPREARDASEQADAVIAALPDVAAHAEFADVFCEPDIFDLALTERILRAARDVGLGLRVHADQLVRSGGAALAVGLGATSVDHLEQATVEDAREIAVSRTVATLLPGPALMLGRGLPPARALVDAGAVVALGSDANAGTFGNPDMTLAVGLAVGALRLSVAEALLAATWGSARSLGLDTAETPVGRIAPGFAADLVAWDAEHEGAFALRLAGVTPVSVWRAGRRAGSS